MPEKNHAAKTPSIHEVRAALQAGPMSRDALAKQFNTSRGEIAKPIYALRKSGALVEEDGLASLVSLVAEASTEAPEPQPVLGPTGPGKEEAVRRVLEALQERAGVWERGWVTMEEDAAHPEKIDSSPDSSQAMAPAVSDLDRAWPITHAPDIEAALHLILAELPGLLRDREKLQKLREVLG